jgi:ribonuclease P protein subunit POP4
MYDPLDQKFFKDAPDEIRLPPGMTPLSSSARPLDMDVHADREIFVDRLLSTMLNEEKLKEKDSIADKLKYKKHQLEVASKQLRREAKAKREQNQPNGKQQRKKLVLTAKTKKRLGMFKLSKDAKLDYNKYLKINEVWCNYAAACLLTCLPKTMPTRDESEMGSILSEESALNCLKQIDYHGALLTVTRSNCRTLVGLSGVVLQDRRNVFFILNKNNEVKVVSKAGCLFEFELFGCVKMTLVGSNMMHKPEMRVTKHAKIKTKIDIV